MKEKYQYRFYTTDEKQQKLARFLGCIRVVLNDFHAAYKQSEKKPESEKFGREFKVIDRVRQPRLRQSMKYQ